MTQRPEDTEEFGDLVMDLARYYFYHQRMAEAKLQNSRNARAQMVYDMEASIYAEAASDARQVALWLQGDIDQRPMCLDIGSDAEARPEPQEEGEADGLDDPTEIPVEGDDERED